MAEHIMRLRIENKEVEAHSDNTFVFRHLGKLAVYDHAYVKYGEGDQQNACYIWNDAPIYPDFVKRAEEAGAEIHINLHEIHKADEANFIKHHTTDLGDTLPEAWMKKPE